MLIFYLIKKIITDILPLLYYLKYFILHVGYKSLQSGFYIYIYLYIENFSDA